MLRLKSSKKKALGVIGGLILIVLFLPLFAAFEAHVINVKARIENALEVAPQHIDFATVFPQETLEATFSVTLSDSFLSTSRTVDVEYTISQELKPIPDSSPPTTYKDLGPFLYKTKDASETDFDTETFASLDQSTGDIEDNWLVQLYVPCISSSECKGHGTAACPTFPCGGPRHATCQSVLEDPPGSGEAGDWGADIWVEVTGISYPQNMALDWVREFGTATYEHNEGVAADPSGNGYAVGYTFGTLPGQSSLGGMDAFARKYDPSGNVLWTRQFGTTDFDWAESAATDGGGNVYIAGYTWGIFPGQSSSGVMDAFVRKYDTNGNVIWTRQFGSSDPDGAYFLATDPSGNVVVGGFTDGTLPGQSSSGSTDAFVRKYDSSGNILWTRQFGTSGTEDVDGVAADSSGNVLVTGATDGTLPGQSSSGLTDAFARKYDPSGSELWTRQFGTATDDVAHGISADPSGNVFLAGYTFGTLPGQSSSGVMDAYVRKYDPIGNEIWTQQFGSANDDAAHGIASDPSGNIWIAGYTRGTLPGQSSLGGMDAFIRKYDTNGNVKWTSQFGTPDFDWAYGIATDPSGSLFLAGDTEGTFPGESFLGWNDAFIARLTN